MWLHEVIAGTQMKGFGKGIAEDRVTIGESVRIHRELADLSQIDLSRITGLSKSMISAIENDQRQLSVESAKLIASALKCHPAVLIFPGWYMEKDPVT